MCIRDRPLTALLTQANGQSQVIETIYPERFRHCEQLNKMGANIELDESMCYINGKTPLKGAKVEATDLRCGAALLIACLLYTSLLIDWRQLPHPIKNFLGMYSLFIFLLF